MRNFAGFRDSPPQSQNHMKTSRPLSKSALYSSIVYIEALHWPFDASLAKQYGRDNEGQDSEKEEDFSEDDGDEEEEGDDDDDEEEDEEDESEEEDSLRTPKRATGKAGAVGGSTSVKGKGKAVAKKPKSKGVKKNTSYITKRGRTSGVKLTPLTAQEKSEFDALGSQTSRLIQAPKKKAMLSKAA
ncbi:hypothetical protein CF328_g7385 [Tilletia controversa]|nr:hypothetical protein CF328_g7385 [Tilletia controversa]